MQTMNESDTKYNGWTNYETWAVKLWIDNEQSTHEYWLDTAREILKNAQPESVFTAREKAVFQLSEILKDQHEEALPRLDGFAADLLNAAFSEINWHEIAESLIESAGEQ